MTTSFYRRLRLSLLLAVGVALLVPVEARANERHFTYTYESAVLPEGAKELEVWSTARIGKPDYFVRFDERLEFEAGVTDNLMTALYLNLTSIAADVGDERITDTEFAGVSSEWKLKLSDPVADGLGVALYGELTAAPTELEVEAKLILDKQIGNMLLAANLVLANETEFEKTPDEEEVEQEQEIEVDLAIAWFLRPGLSAGLEVRNHNEIHGGEHEHSALFAGPVFGYATDSWWLALTILPQLPAIVDNDDAVDDGPRVLDEHEKLEARLLFSFHM